MKPLKSLKSTVSSIQQNKTKVKKLESDSSSRDKTVNKSRMRNDPDMKFAGKAFKINQINRKKGQNY